MCGCGWEQCTSVGVKETRGAYARGKETNTGENDGRNE